MIPCIYHYVLSFQATTGTEPEGSGYFGPDLIVQNSVIKGFHINHIHPPMTNPPTRLRVDLEYTNIKDENALLVWVPDIERFSSELVSLITDKKRYLKLSDIAGLPVGHVPWGHSSVVKQLIEKGCIVHAQSTSDPTPSFPPCRTRERGGGVVIPCNYIINCKNITIGKAKKFLQSLCKMPEDKEMSVKVTL